MTRARASTAVVVTIDDDYLRPAACLIGSLADTSPESVEQVIILGCDLSEATSSALHRLATRLGLPLEVRDITRELQRQTHLPVGPLRPTVWARLLVPDACKDVDRCLYLDADTICLRDIGPLLGADLGTRVVGAVQDVFHPTLGSPVCLPDLDLNRRQRQEPYFNAGVLLIDVLGWRSADVTNEALAFVRQSPQSVRFLDQDALNAVLIGRWQPLDRIWNVPPARAILDTLGFGYFGRKQLNSADLARLEDGAGIVHYLTELKPWTAEFPRGLQLDRYRSAYSRIAFDVDAPDVDSEISATRRAWTTFQGQRAQGSPRSGSNA